MAKIADIIKYEGDNSTFVWKHPCEDFNTTTQTSLDKGTQRKTTENELPSLTQCTA